MNGTFDRLWWLLALRGLAGLGLAVLAFTWPMLTLESLLFGFGVYVAFDGALAIVAGLERHENGFPFWPFVIEGALGLLFAALIVAWPDTMAFALWYLIAGWALATGACELFAAIKLRRAYAGETILVRAGMASVVFGFVVALWPRNAMITLAWLVGIYAALFGASLFFLAMRLRQLAHRAAGQAELTT